jgi:ABC-type ATPase involved in cell division
MFKPKITLSATVYDKIKTAAKLIGASSVEEFAERVLSAEADKVLAERSPKQPTKVSDAEVERIAQQMKGLGYLE